MTVAAPHPSPRAALPSGAAVIDCDVHAAIDSIEQLFPWLDPHWREVAQTTQFRGPTDTAYPPGAATSLRPDLAAESAPAGSVDAVRQARPRPVGRRGRHPRLPVRHRGGEEPRRRCGTLHCRQPLAGRGLARPGAAPPWLDRHPGRPTGTGRRGDRACRRAPGIRPGAVAGPLVCAVRAAHLVAGTRGSTAPRAGPRADLRRRCAASSTGHQMRCPYGANERTGNSTWTNPGCSAARSISSTACAGWPPGMTIEPRRRGSRSSQSSTSQRLAAVESAAAASGFFTASVPYWQTRMAASTSHGSRVSLRTASTLPAGADSAARSGRRLVAAPGGYAVSVGPRNWVVCATSRQWGSSQGKSCSIESIAACTSQSITVAPLGRAARGDEWGAATVTPGAGRACRRA